MNTNGKYRNNNIVLIGMKHVGKTTIGKILSRRLAIPFTDLDHEIERKVKKAGIHSVRELFKKQGREGLKRYEKEALHSILAAHDGRNNGMGRIIATGGGVVENESVMKVLKKQALIVYLEDDSEHIFSRIKKNGIPPFLDTANPYASFIELCHNRKPLYELYADIHFHIEGKLPEQTADELYGKLARYIS